MRHSHTPQSVSDKLLTFEDQKTFIEEDETLRVPMYMSTISTHARQYLYMTSLNVILLQISVPRIWRSILLRLGH